MGTTRKLPDVDLCRTCRLFDTTYYLCLTDDPGICAYLNRFTDTFICNHILRSDFIESDAAK